MKTIFSLCWAGIGWLWLGCQQNPGQGQPQGARPEPAIIAIDGSSTVFPIAEAVAEEFQKTHPARVTIGVSGSGGGFQKFCQKEIAISDASRPIKQSEIDLCAKNGVAFIELPIAYDGISIIVHKQADWVDWMSVAELAKLWSPAAQASLTRWNQIRTAWPDAEIRLYGPGVDSGTYDYFTAAVVGTEHASRGDFTSSEDDNVLVQGVSRDKLALGFVGLAYYTENADKLKAVAIDDGNPDNGAGPILPSAQTVADGTYQPLSRPLFLYVSKAAAERAEVQAFVTFFLSQGRPLVREAGFIPLPEQAQRLVEQRFARRTEGTLFAGQGSRVGVTVEALLSQP